MQYYKTDYLFPNKILIKCNGILTVLCKILVLINVKILVQVTIKQLLIKKKIDYYEERRKIFAKLVANVLLTC